jgi:hypothetical protein
MHAKTLILSLACHGKHSETTQTAREALQAIGINSDRLTTTERPGSTQHNGERLRMHGQHSTQPKFTSECAQNQLGNAGEDLRITAEWLRIQKKHSATLCARLSTQTHLRETQNVRETLRIHNKRPESTQKRSTQNTREHSVCTK